MTLLEKLNDIANRYECEVEFGNEFAYYYSESLIVVNPADKDNDFVEFAYKNGLNKEVNSFVASFFHELGHNETLDFVDEYKGNKNALTNQEYYNLDEEIVATEWAIEYCNNHINEVKEIISLL